jgi:hypothetical protein
MRLLELFSGTGSVGKVFRDAGWEVTSVDMDREAGATITADIMKWDYRAFEPRAFEVIWASPPCTHYSCARTNAKTPRDLEGSDAIVQRTLDIIAYLQPLLYFMENPGTGLLKTRPVVRGLPYKKVTYCSYGYPYRKLTFLWTNAEYWTPRRCCRKDCWAMVDGRHAMTAQRGPFAAGQSHDRCTLQELYSVPKELVEEILVFCVKHIFYL